MSYYKKNFIAPLRLFFILLVAMALSNCANIQPSETTRVEQSNPLAVQAQEALSQQRFAVAAQLFVQLANGSNAPLKNQHFISAIDAYLKANDLANADLLISVLLDRSSQLSANSKLQLASALLNQGKAENAIQLLMSIDESNLATQQRIHLHTLSSSAFFQSGNLIESARERVLLDALLNQSDEKLNNQAELLEVLSLLSEQALTFLRPTADNNMAGWIDLALIFKQQVIFNANSSVVDVWKEQHPSHTANGAFLYSLAEQAQIDFKTPDKVGVFLPSQGPFATAAQSIRKGITAAAYSMANSWPLNITFYDTSAASIETLYQQAINDGINVIIGPLDKANIAKITALNELAIPVIGLNKNGNHHSHNYYEFSLSPEEDITQVLSLAWLKGHEKALILAPQSRSGERLARHFSTLWQQLGGDILGVQTYPLKQADYSAPIKNLLQIDNSIHRFKQLRQRLNLNIEFEERRRHDADFIFLLAAPREGRLIKPQLRFHRAANVTVFSTSKIYEGELNKVANRDLDGTFFCDMPWLIEPNNELDDQLNKALKLWPNARGLHRRLLAFGYDAYQLIPHLERLQSNDFARLKGKTGILAVNNSNVISRQLSCGRFKRGSIKSLGLAPHLERALNMLPADASSQELKQPNTSPL
ncbi:MAG: penicillin-binding protein activator [Cycloclasticus sp.]